MNNTKNLRFFVIVTYVGFYILLGFCGLIMAWGVSKDIVSTWAPKVLAWISLAVIMIWAKKLLPRKTKTEYIKGLFRDKPKPKWILISFAVPIVIFFVSVLLLSVILHKQLGNLIDSNFGAYPLLLLGHLISGPIGEELGWRGYFFAKENEKRGVLKGSLLTALVWGLWHAPLWAMNGYGPLELIVYSLAFMVAFTGFNLLVCHIYATHKNLIYPIIVHLMFNFLSGIIVVSLDELVVGMVIFAVLYIGAGIVAAKTLKSIQSTEKGE